MTEVEQPEKFPTGAGLKALEDLPESQDDVLIGRRLGDYDVTGFIAAGGMSRVYLASRSDGSFERDVAIKVSPGSSLSDDMRDRFLREQAVLATLNHAHITQLYDAHVTDEGWPYIVMEHVDGVPLTEHCIDNNLNDRNRLRLFNEIVDAVSYAHVRLVIHRDIKPSNVLVDWQGGTKLLDFGIAKLLEPDATQTAIAPLTPRYASPEQLLGDVVTISSDIYQLGLLLAEVLLGKPLIEDDTLTSAIERAAGRIPVTIAPEDRRRLAKELVQIIEQCLRVNPDERYAAASELRDDIDAYLKGYPVQAVGQSTGYRIQKFAARHKLGTAITSVAVFAAISAITWYTWQLDNARQQAEANALEASLAAEEANQVAEFLKDLLAAAKPSNALGEDVTVRQVLDVGLDRVRTELEEPALKASLLEIMGDVYRQLGDFEQSEELLLESIELQRGIDNPIELATSLEAYGQLLRTRGEWQASVPVMQAALSHARRVSDDDALLIQANILQSLGFSTSKLNNFEAAATYYREAIALRSDVLGADHLVTSQSVSGLGFLLYKTGQFDEAVELLEDALRVAEDSLEPHHPIIATRSLNLSSEYLRRGRFSEAEALVRKAMASDKHVYGPDHHYVASGMLSLAAVYRWQGDFARAAETIEQALPIETASLGERHVDTGNSRTTLAFYHAKSGNYPRAEELIVTATEIFDENGLGDHHYVLQLIRTRGVLKQATGAYSDALVFYEEALAMATRLYGPDHHRNDLIAGAARAHAGMDDFETALPLYADAIERMQAKSPGPTPELTLLREEYAQVLEQAGQQDRAQVVRQETRSLTTR